jgi:NAD(P)-dependent dehydrogenase (short-subunit alcohol dehydrogenase family)
LVFLINSLVFSGASRGIGFGLTKHLLEFNPTLRVIATCRDPSTSTQLTELSALFSKERLLVLQLDTTSADSYTAAVAELTAQDITSLDCVVANAGIGSRHSTLNCPASNALEVYNTNVVGSMLTAQAFHGLLMAGDQKEAAAPGLMVFISSVMGSIEKTKSESHVR